MTHKERISRRRAILQPFEGILGNVGIVLSSNVVIAALGFLTLAFVSQALGPAGLGILVLTEAYARAFDTLLRLEPTQALIREGTRHRTLEDRGPFLRLVKFGLTLDVVGSVGAAVLAMVSLGFVAGWFGFGESEISYAMMFCVAMLVPGPATMVGLFRMFSRFKAYSRTLVLAAALRAAASGILLLDGAGLEAFVIMTAAMVAIERLLPNIVGWAMLRRQIGPGLVRTRLASVTGENPGLWRFIVMTNMNAQARSSIRRYDVIVLGTIITPAEMGLYIIARRIAMVLFRIGAPLQLVAYPRICELVNDGKIQRMVKMVVAVCGLFLMASALAVAAYVAVGPYLLVAIFGDAYAASTVFVLYQLIGACLLLSGTILNAALQALRQEGRLLAISIAASLSFFLPLPFVVPVAGVLGVSILHVIVGLVWCVGAGVLFYRALSIPVLKAGDA